ncbi:MAG TPA: hypothetical protein VF786_06310, partial [Terriglobales bacterium]
MRTMTFIKQATNAGLVLGSTAALIFAMNGCKGKQEGDGAPPPVKVVQVPDMNVITISSDDAARFKLVSAEKYESVSELTATGAVSPDVSREV